MMTTNEVPVLEALPAGEENEAIAASERSVVGLAELLLKDPRRVDRLTRESGRLPDLLPRLLAIALASFTIHSLTLAGLLTGAPTAALPGPCAAHWAEPGRATACLWASYTIGLVAASGLCLPSFYFQGLLAGVKVSMADVTAHVLKGKATTAIMLLGLLPIYLAVVLGLLVFRAPTEALQLAFWVGLALPFVAGLWGVRSIYRGFTGLADTLPDRVRGPRADFLGRLTLAWAGCYTAVTPFVIWTLWERLLKLA